MHGNEVKYLFCAKLNKIIIKNTCRTCNQKIKHTKILNCSLIENPKKNK